MRIEEKIQIIKNDCFDLTKSIDCTKIKIEYYINKKIGDRGKLAISRVISPLAS